MSRAFTLVELLVVTAVLAILAALLFPVLARARTAARTTETLAHLRGLGMATLLYAGSADDRPPLVTEGPRGAGREGGYTFAVEYRGDGAGRFDPSRGALYPYTRAERVYASSLDPTVARSRQSFAFNGCLAEFPPSPGLLAARPLGAVAHPSNQFLFAEEDSNGQGTNDGFFHPLVDTLATWHPARRTAMAFVDGHAALVNAEGGYPEFVDAAPDPCWPYDPLIDS